MNEFPILYAKDSKGRIKVWSAEVILNTNRSSILRTISGLQDGKRTPTDKIIRKGKNIGKKSETTSYTQAVSEGRSKMNKKIDEGYVKKIEDIKQVKLPMLAQKFSDRKHKIVYPALLQPKLNGVRCFVEKISDTEIKYTSRKGKQYTTLSHLNSVLLKNMTVGDIWDGEIYNHEMTFQEIISAVKRQRESSFKLEFWCYDIADDKTHFEDRWNRLLSVTEEGNLIIVQTKEVNSEGELHKMHDYWVNQNFEGAIIRNKIGKYTFKHRSVNLQKIKSFIDEEFLIVGGYTGEGTTFEGCVTFECKAKNGQIFGCVPKGTHEYKKKLWKDLDKIVKAKTKLTVRYQELSDGDIPIFPIGVALRDYE